MSLVTCYRCGEPIEQDTKAVEVRFDYWYSDLRPFKRVVLLCEPCSKATILKSFGKIE